MRAPNYRAGYLRVPLAIWTTVFYRGFLTRRQLQLVAVVLRESWGWQRPGGEVSLWTRPLSSTQFAQLTGLSTDHLARDLRRLIRCGVLLERGSRYQFVADPAAWTLPRRSAEAAAVSATSAVGSAEAAPAALASKNEKIHQTYVRTVKGVPDSCSVHPLAERFLQVLVAFAGPLGRQARAGLCRRLEQESMAAVWRGLEPALKQGRSAARKGLHTYLADRTGSVSLREGHA